MIRRILKAIEEAESIDSLRIEVKKLSNGLEELADAMKALASVVRQHNLAIKATAEENEYIVSMIKGDLGEEPSADFFKKSSDNKEKPN